MGRNRDGKKKLDIARQIFIRAAKGLPTDKLAAQYPDIVQKMNDYFLCKQLHCLPEAGGLNDQYLDDYLYFMTFTKVELEITQS